MKSKFLRQRQNGAKSKNEKATFLLKQKKKKKNGHHICNCSQRICENLQVHYKQRTCVISFKSHLKEQCKLNKLTSMCYWKSMNFFKWKKVKRLKLYLKDLLLSQIISILLERSFSNKTSICKSLKVIQRHGNPSEMQSKNITILKLTPMMS